MTKDGTLRETIARIINPGAWRVLDSYLDEFHRMSKGGIIVPPDRFKDNSSLLKADAILAALSQDAKPEPGVTVTEAMVERAIGELDASLFIGPWAATLEACRDHMLHVLTAALQPPVAAKQRTPTHEQ